MAEIVGVSTYQLPSGRPIRLKKWSVKKFFTLVRELSSVAEQVYPHLGSGKTEEILRALALTGETGLPVLARVIKDSLDEPEISVECVQDWDLEDVLGVLKQILDTNFTEGLSRNFRGLRDVVQTKLRSLPTSA